MNEQEKVHITIFQAPFTSLMDIGLYMKMYDSSRPFQETVPAEYYLAVYDGEIECSKPLPEDKEQRTYMILEEVFSIFNTKLPAGYCSRSLSVGDVVQLEGHHYLCVAVGFRPVIFTTSQRYSAKTEPRSCTLTMPDGSVLRATAHLEREYSCINVDLIAADGTSGRVCFVEHNPEKEPGHELCVGVYCAGNDETVYYNSYHPTKEVNE